MSGCVRYDSSGHCNKILVEQIACVLELLSEPVCGGSLAVFSLRLCFHLGVVHPRQDVALHQCFPLLSNSKRIKLILSF